MTKQPSVKILVGYHKPAVLLKSDVLVPIHLGRALATKASKDGVMSQEDYQWMLDNMIGDNTGDNISHLNREFCELTAIYWAWKNYDKLGNPDYIGFMHYRRHCSFNIDRIFSEDQYGLVYADKVNDEYLSKFKINSSHICNIIQNYDVIVAKKTDLKKLGTNSPYNHYENSDSKLHIKDYNLVLKILSEKYPEFAVIAEKYNHSKYAYFTNIFVMKREIYNKYCAWLFDILFEARKKIDFENYNAQEYRVLAYISEWLCGIYITYLYQKACKILELQRTFINNPDIKLLPNVRPAFERNNIGICLASDKNYALYLGVTIKSIVDCSSLENNYDILVFENDFDKLTKCKLLSLIENHQNFHIRFISIEEYLAKYKDINFSIHNHFTKAVYYRLFIPQILNQYEKIVYLDTDLIIKQDIADFYKENIQNYSLGAIEDFEMNRLYYTEAGIKNYIDNILKLKSISHYFNSGVLLMNLHRLRLNNITDKSMNLLNIINNPIMVDQDILNKVCGNDTKLLDAKWNYEFHIPIWASNYKNELPVKKLTEYEQSSKNPKIIHYAGATKPWQNPSLPMADIWWKYARLTPFYEEIIYKNLSQNRNISLPQNPPSLLMKDVIQRRKNRLKYYKYKLLSKITFGKVRKKYKQKKKMLKNRLKAVDRFLKGK